MAVQYSGVRETRTGRVNDFGGSSQSAEEKFAGKCLKRADRSFAQGLQCQQINSMAYLLPKAQFNLLVSPWVGLKNVKNLEKRFGTPFLHLSTLPVGATETSKFLREVGAFAGIDSSKVESIITEHEKYFYYLIERYADLFLENRVINKQFC